MVAKSESRKAKNKYLTIEFAGICALITRKATQGAEVWLPDVMKAAPAGQRTEHYASLIVRTEEAQSVVADSAVTVPAQPPDTPCGTLPRHESPFSLTWLARSSAQRSPPASTQDRSTSWPTSGRFPSRRTSLRHQPFQHRSRSRQVSWLR